MGLIKFFFVLSIVVLAVFALFFMASDVVLRLTGFSIGDLYSKDLELKSCIDTGKWESENQDFKLTECPDDKPLMKGVGIAVKDDDQSGGIANCCKAKYAEVSDCKEESYWEKDTQDYKMTVCPADRPIMKGIGIKVKNDNQAGGKVYCCKADNVELYSCAITNYWRNSNEDFKINYCPEDRPILGGAGFHIKDNNQAGGKIYCCKGKVKLISGQEAEQIAVEETPAAEEKNETGEVKEIGEEVESAGRIISKLICKILYSKDKDKYMKCIGG